MSLFIYVNLYIVCVFFIQSKSTVSWSPRWWKTRTRSVPMGLTHTAPHCICSAARRHAFCMASHDLGPSQCLGKEKQHRLSSYKSCAISFAGQRLNRRVDNFVALQRVQLCRALAIFSKILFNSISINYEPILNIIVMPVHADALQRIHDSWV